MAPRQLRSIDDALQKRPKAPYLQQDNKTPAPRLIYTNIPRKIIIAPFDAKFKGANSFFLQLFFQSRSVYTRGWIIKRLFVHLDKLKCFYIVIYKLNSYERTNRNTCFNDSRINLRCNQRN